MVGEGGGAGGDAKRGEKVSERYRAFLIALRQANLRPTRQRLLLGRLLFASVDRHVSADELYEEARHARPPLSRATVYNTLRQFVEAGLLREVALFGGKTLYDTQIGSHSHFYVQETNELINIPEESAPEVEVHGPFADDVLTVDVLIRLRRRVKRVTRRDLKDES